MPEPTDPKLVPLYEAAKKMHAAKLRMEQAEKEAKALDAVATAFKEHRAAADSTSEESK